MNPDTPKPIPVEPLKDSPLRSIPIIMPKHPWKKKKAA